MSDSRSPASAGQVGRAFRTLAEEHVAAREDDAEAAWDRLAARRSRPLVLLPSWRGHSWKWLLAPAVGAGLAAMAVAWLWARPSELGYELEGGSVSREVVATESEPATLVFSDDSRVDVAPGSTLRVVVEEERRVVTRLSAGALAVHVEHHDDTDYRFWAGPYEVVVVGTRFSLAFDSREERMDLTLHEGQVRVYDEARRPHVIKAGQSLSLSKHKPEVAAVPAAAAPAAGVPDSALPATATDPETHGSSRPSEGAARTAGEYASLAASGRFKEIVRLAEQAGIERVLAEKSGSELQELAQAALYSGRADLAERTWKLLRSRFAGQTLGTNAGFFLGRQADQTGHRREARVLLDGYLREAPRGVYAAEALGRKLVLVHATDGPAAARGVARSYLAAFPNGPYATQARELVR